MVLLKTRCMLLGLADLALREACCQPFSSPLSTGQTESGHEERDQNAECIRDRLVLT